MNLSKDEPIADWDQLDDLLGAMREKTAEHDRKVSKRDAEVSAVAAKHSAKIDELAAELKGMEVRALVFLEANRAEFGEPVKEGGKRQAAPRSRALVHGRVGARQSPARLETLRGLSFDDVVEYLQASGRVALKKFVRTVHSLDKAKVVEEMDEATLLDVGLEIKRDDKLFVDLKKA